MVTFAQLLAFLAAASPAMAGDINSVISQFSPEKPHWHEYSFIHPLCSNAANPKCTREIVKAALLRNVMPCQDPSHRAKDGDFLLPHDPNTGCVYSPGHVILGVYDNVGVVAISILTHTDHALYDGVVLRYLEEKDGNFWIRTRGIGNNKSDLWAATNRQLGQIIFNAQDDRVREYLENCFANNGKGCE